MTDFQFKCSTCNELHLGIPTFGADYPMTVLQIPEEEREARVELGSDDCVIDEKDFYVRGCIEIPVEGYDEPFTWGTWVSLSEASYRTYVQYFDEAKRSDVEPFFGWHCCDFIAYDETCLNLKTRVHMRDDGIRPFIELEPTEHPLAIEQREGITKERLKEIYELVMHGK
jgi:hypothetical protein